MKRIGVLLAGAGVQDGSEIHEATLTLLYLAQHGAAVVCLAPEAPQTKVIDHRTGQSTAEQRDMLTEAARIARGEIQPLSAVPADALDGLIIPGGMGAALNLCDYGERGQAFSIREDVAALLQALRERGKPIGAICIAPVIVAGLFGRAGLPVEVTIGDDPHVAADIEAWGARHIARRADQAHVDREHAIATTPAYMLGRNAAEIAPGISAVVAAVLEMAKPS
ncbi:MAG: isoprenoid biosynthesis glyoxalase ElbB [Candidatus Eisenbacteria bacterium]|nr:isoprenoid biosynthesis glyoxalase ElbB [Candidatus Eisenbacteria bacterium]